MNSVALPSKNSVNLSGWLMKKGRIFHMWKRYFVQLHNSELIIRRNDYENRIRHRYVVNNSTAVKLISNGKHNEIQIRVSPDKTICLTTPEEKSLSQWFNALTYSNSHLSMDSFDVISVIGRGHFGKVVLAMRKATHEYCAIKSIKKKCLSDRNQLSLIVNERNTLTKINHPFTVNILFAFQTWSKFYIGMEYIPGGDLVGLLTRKGKLELKDVIIYAGEVALALEYIHSKGIVYRDLKPENIVINSDGHLKLADFGLSKDISESKTTSTFCGTADYMAPEMLFKKAYDYSVDWWAFGILVYEMLFDMTPFHSELRDSTFSKIKFCDPIYPEGTDPNVISFINGFLEKDPLKRTKYSDVENHPFWQGITREDLLNKKYTPTFIPTIGKSISTEYFDHKYTGENPLESIADPMLDEKDIFFGFSYMGDEETAEEDTPSF